MDREGRIAAALLVLLAAGAVAVGIATGTGDDPPFPELAQVQGRLLVCDRLPADGTTACPLAAGFAPAIRIRIRNSRYRGLWEAARFGGVFPPGRYTASGSLDGAPIRRVSFRLSLAHPTRLVLVAEGTRT
jgi:hypothetical protein